VDWPEELELDLDGIAQGGEAVGRWHERVVFAGGGLPGERVRVRLDERRESFARGSVIEVLTASPDRVAPLLPGADHLPWQHIAHAAQLRFREQILREQLTKFGVGDPPVAPTLTASAPWGYRNNARLHIAGERIGYHAAGARAIVPLESDPLLLPGLNDALAGLRHALTAGSPTEEPFDVVLRVSETFGYTLGALLAPAAEVWQTAARWRAYTPGLAGVAIGQARDQSAIGASELVEEFAGLTFILSPTTFFQVNLAAAERLLDLVRAGLALTGRERLLDLYCGAGTFALPLASAAGEIVGIEEYAPAIADARASAEANSITNVRFIAGHVEGALGALDDGCDAVVLDPPRRGCHPRALQTLLQLAPQRIVYVSCHPGTLARDLKILADGGYTIERVTPVDLFPQTAHVESVTILHR
jgi:23S rRNA (uracil1939-C5)-methyltransferase